MKKGTKLILFGLLLIAAALILVGYNFWDDSRAGKDAESALEKLFPSINGDPVPEEGRFIYGAGGYIIGMEYPDYVLNPDMPLPHKNIDGKNYVGVLSMPTIERELAVIDQWNYTNLKTAPCVYMGTPYLNNMVICAHNYRRHFGYIKNLKIGDEVTFTDMDGNVFQYEVLEVEILKPMEIEKMTTGDWDMTLFTCTIGGRTRVTVRCGRI